LIARASESQHRALASRAGVDGRGYRVGFSAAE
jgi:hypothetical protein